MTRAAYCVRADGGRYAEAFKDGGYAAIGWDVGDLSGIPPGDEEALRAAYHAAYPDDGKMRRGINVGQIGRFAWVIEPGDVVVTPIEESRYLLIGVVDSGYYYEDTPECPYAHRRKVRWAEEPVLRYSFSVPVQGSLRSALTVFSVRPPDELLRAAGLEPPTPEPVERVEKDLSAIVLERLMELDSDEFEVLVAELLTALGFEAEKIGRTGDGGVDVEGVLDVYGFARAELKVQVKRYRQGNTVDHETVSRFLVHIQATSWGMDRCSS